jgi:16S rRNA (guanine527-N7)-methyltransferase
VKRNPSDSSIHPEKIVDSVRIRVDAFLHNMPDVVGVEFSERIDKLVGCLALWGAKMNLTAHPDDPEEVAFHVIDSLMPIILAGDKSSILAGQFSAGQNALDLGSGAGFPGLVLAAASVAAFTLVESRRKRASFLQVALAEMGMQNVTIEGRRAEDIGLAGQYDLVTARAFGEVTGVTRLAAQALRPGGIAILYANPSQRAALSGLEIIEYSVARRAERMPRILGVLRKA